MAYNQRVSRRLNQATDLMLGSQVAARGPGQLWLAAADGYGRFEVRIPNHSGAIDLRHDGRLAAQVPVEPGLLRGGRWLELSLFDAQVLLAIDGQVRLQYAYDRAGKKPSPAPEPLAVGARRLDVVLRDLTVWRDIHYTHPPQGRWGGRRAWQLGPDEVFVLGDNSPVSDDSRSWSHGGGLPTRLLVGSPLGVD